MFSKDLKRVRKCEQATDEMVKDVNGQILRIGVEVRRLFLAGPECGRCQGVKYQCS